MEDWTQEEVQELLQKILNATSDITNKSFKCVEAAMDWDSLQINGKSGEECKVIFQLLISKVRKFRTMFEIVTDAIQDLNQEGSKKINSKLYPDLPKKPISAYALYVKKRAKKLPGMSFAERSAVLSQEWKALPEEKKEGYKQKFLKRKEKYDQELELFTQKHPEVKVKTSNLPKPQVPVPSRLYQEAKLCKILEKHPEMTNANAIKKCQSKYHGLSDKRKVIWIKRAQQAKQAYQEDCVAYMKKHPDFKPAEFHLTREEIKILHASYGKPSSPPKNLFLYFMQENKDKLSQITFAERSKEISSIYRSVPENEINELQQNYVELMKNYIEQYNTFYNNLPEEEKPNHQKPDAVLKKYNNAIKNAIKQKKKTIKVKEKVLKRPHEVVSPEVASKKMKTDVPSAVANISLNASSNGTLNSSSSSRKQKKRKDAENNPTD